MLTNTAAGPTLERLIQDKYAAMPRGQKAVAKFVLGDLSSVYTCTTLELAALAGVSNATVVRFASALGFSGYAELQKMFRQALVTGRYLEESPLPGHEDNRLDRILERQIKQLAQSLSRITQEDFIRVVDAIASARRIYITGTRMMFAPAYFLARMLNFFFQNTSFLPFLGENAYEELLTAGTEDLFFCISISRYSRNSFSLTELAAERNIPIAVVTDNPLSPAAKLAEMVLKINAETSTIGTSILGLTSLMEAIIFALSSRSGLAETIRSNLNEFDRYAAHRIFFVDNL